MRNFLRTSIPDLHLTIKHLAVNRTRLLTLCCIPSTSFHVFFLDTPWQLKQGDSCFSHSLHWQTPYGTHVLTQWKLSISYIYTVPVCPTVQVFYLLWDCTAVLFQNIDTSFVSRSWTAWHLGALPDTNAQIFHQLDFRSHRNCRSDCSDTSLVLSDFISIPASFYIPASQKLLPRNTGIDFDSLWFRIIP